MFKNNVASFKEYISDSINEGKNYIDYMHDEVFLKEGETSEWLHEMIGIYQKLYLEVEGKQKEKVKKMIEKLQATLNE